MWFWIFILIGVFVTCLSVAMPDFSPEGTGYNQYKPMVLALGIIITLLTISTCFF